MCVRESERERAREREREREELRVGSQEGDLVRVFLIAKTVKHYSYCVSVCLCVTQVSCGSLNDINLDRSACQPFSLTGWERCALCL